MPMVFFRIMARSKLEICAYHLKELSVQKIIKSLILDHQNSSLSKYKRPGIMLALCSVLGNWLVCVVYLVYSCKTTYMYQTFRPHLY